ncbi:MAG: transcriptional regulator NrdR [Thermoflexales bacterium]|nr:transcriptional regulator NrdR [Thermoflexales bacterium]
MWREEAGAMQCPFCQAADTKVIDSNKNAHGGVRRRRVCQKCGRRFSTIERVVESLPLVIKRGGRREAFNRDKVAEGIRIACAKRPVAAADIERLVDQVEAQVVALNKPEVSAREIGDMVLEGLRKLDEVAYIRYAIVYLNLKDLESVKAEIEKLLSER